MHQFFTLVGTLESMIYFRTLNLFSLAHVNESSHRRVWLQLVYLRSWWSISLNNYATSQIYCIRHHKQWERVFSVFKRYLFALTIFSHRIPKASTTGKSFIHFRSHKNVKRRLTNESLIYFYLSFHTYFCQFYFLSCILKNRFKKLL